MIQLSLTTSRANGEVCRSHANELSERMQKWEGSVVRAIAHRFQSNQNQQESLSWYISTFKSLSLLSVLLTLTFQSIQERGISGCSYGNTWLFKGRRQQGGGNPPTLCHAMATDFYV